MGYISSLPASISNIITYFEKCEKDAKLSDGPALPRPGPMLFIVAATAVNVLTKSKLSNATRITDATNTNIHEYIRHNENIC